MSKKEEKQPILPPWLQGVLVAPTDDHSVDYGSSIASDDDYSEDSSHIIDFSWEPEKEQEPGFIQVQIEWSQLFAELSHSENSFIEVLQGPNLNLLEFFLEECPTPHCEGNLNTSTASVLHSLCEEHQSPRPMIDVRRTEMTSEKNKDCIIWNDLLEFERLNEELSPDDVEEEQRQCEEKRMLWQLERCGQLGKQGLLSSLDSTALPEFTLDVLDAEAMLLVRVCGARSDDRHEVVLAQCLIVIDSLRKIAVPEEADMLFSTHQLHSRSLGFHVGLIRVGLRFRLPHEHESQFDHTKHREYFEAELITETLFEKYDTNGDGYLTRREFVNFVRELSNVGGNINQLEECDNGSRLLGSCIPLPAMDLFSYIKHNHTLLVVCFNQPKYLRKHMASTTWERLGFVLMSLLWSLSVNCLVEIYMNTSRLWQVTTITLVDSCGRSLMNGFFIIAHLRCWSRVYQRCVGRRSKGSMPSQNTCDVLSLLVFIVFLIFFATWLLLAMSPEQLYSSGYSFIPIWSIARVTEVFYWGTAWAFMVQYGSSPSARLTKWQKEMRDRAITNERLRRAQLLLDEKKQWWQVNWLSRP